MKPIPQSTYDRAELLARSHPLSVVAQLVRVHPSVLSRMKARGWRAVDYSCQRRPPPPDFAIQAQHMTHDELRVHYGASARTVGNWFREKPVRPSWHGRHLKRAHRL